MLGGHVKKLENLGFTYSEDFKINIQLRPKVFLLELMDKQLEKSHGTLFLYITAQDYCMHKDGEISHYP